MKIRSVPLGLIIVAAIMEAVLLVGTVAAILRKCGTDTCVLAAAVTAAFAVALVYLLYSQMVFQIDGKGIAIKKWNRLRYFLPWEATETVGLEKGYRGRLTLYVSRYDAEGTRPLTSMMVQFDNMESLPFTINAALSGKDGAKKAEKAPILILHVSSCEEEYKKVLRYRPFP